MNTAQERTASVPFIRRHRTFFAGLFLVIPLVLIPVLLVYTLMKAEFMQKWCHLYTFSESSYGLTRGSPVTISGMTVGHVREVLLINEGVIGIRFKIRESYRSLVHRDTRARFQQKNIVVGDWTIELTGGTPSVPVVAENDTLRSEAPLRLDRTINQVTAMVTSLETMINGILAGKGSVGRLLTEDTLIESVNRITGTVEEVLNNVQTTLSGADTLIGELTTVGRSGGNFIDSLSFVTERIRTVLADAVTVLGNLRGASGEVAPLITDVRSDLDEAERMLQTLQQSWLYRKIAGKRDDPLLKEGP